MDCAEPVCPPRPPCSQAASLAPVPTALLQGKAAVKVGGCEGGGVRSSRSGPSGRCCAPGLSTVQGATRGAAEMLQCIRGSPQERSEPSGAQATCRSSLVNVPVCEVVPCHRGAGQSSRGAVAVLAGCFPSLTSQSSLQRVLHTGGTPASSTRVQAGLHQDACALETDHVLGAGVPKSWQAVEPPHPLFLSPTSLHRGWSLSCHGPTAAGSVPERGPWVSMGCCLCSISYLAETSRVHSPEHSAFLQTGTHGAGCRGCSTHRAALQPCSWPSPLWPRPRGPHRCPCA